MGFSRALGGVKSGFGGMKSGGLKSLVSRAQTREDSGIAKTDGLARLVAQLRRG